MSFARDRKPNRQERARLIDEAVNVARRGWPDLTEVEVVSFFIGDVVPTYSASATYGDCDDPECTDPDAHSPVFVPVRSINIHLRFNSEAGYQGLPS